MNNNSDEKKKKYGSVIKLATKERQAHLVTLKKKSLKGKKE